MSVEIDALLDYAVPQPCVLLLQIVAQSGSDQTVDGSLTLSAHKDHSVAPGDNGGGQRIWLTATGDFRARYKATALVSRTRPVLDGLAATPLHALPPDVIPYLMSSRYCFADALGEFLYRFSYMTGGTLVQALSDWCRTELTYDIFASDPQTTSLDTFHSRRGVCRDFAHLLITMCRSSAIPARMVSVYSPDATPQDFHAVAEVFLDGQWHLIDPTGMTTADRMVRICVGRDAAEVAFLTSFGLITLKNQVVNVRDKP